MANRCSKIDPNRDVPEIRRLYHEEGWTPAMLAEKYGISPSYAVNIANGNRNPGAPRRTFRPGKLDSWEMTRLLAWPVVR